jgi:hypothetical protein
VIELPKFISASPYPKCTGLPPGKLFELYLPSLAAELSFWARLPFRHVRAPAQPSEGSVLGGRGVIEGLDYWVCHETDMLNSVASWATHTMPTLIKRATGVDVRPLHGPQFINVNLLLSGGPRSGYEWHYDPNPITAVCFLTKHEDEGALCYLDESGHMRKVQPYPGLCVVGDFSQTLHAVEAIRRSPFRVSMPIGFGLTDSTAPPESNNAYLYGAR